MLKESVTCFVVGYPMNMDNSPSEAAADVDIFLKNLKKAFPDVPVALEDERFTSVLAHRAMIDGGMKAGTGETRIQLTGSVRRSSFRAILTA